MSQKEGRYSRYVCCLLFMECLVEVVCEGREVKEEQKE